MFIEFVFDVCKFIICSILFVLIISFTSILYFIKYWYKPKYAIQENRKGISACWEVFKKYV